MSIKANESQSHQKQKKCFEKNKASTLFHKKCDNGIELQDRMLAYHFPHSDLTDDREHYEYRGKCKCK